MPDGLGHGAGAHGLSPRQLEISQRRGHPSRLDPVLGEEWVQGGEIVLPLFVPGRDRCVQDTVLVGAEPTPGSLDHRWMGDRIGPLDPPRGWLHQAGGGEVLQVGDHPVTTGVVSVHLGHQLGLEDPTGLGADRQGAQHLRGQHGDPSLQQRGQVGDSALDEVSGVGGMGDETVLDAQLTFVLEQTDPLQAQQGVAAGGGAQPLEQVVGEASNAKLPLHELREVAGTQPPQHHHRGLGQGCQALDLHSLLGMVGAQGHHEQEILEASGELSRKRPGCRVQPLPVLEHHEQGLAGAKSVDQGHHQLVQQACSRQGRIGGAPEGQQTSQQREGRFSFLGIELLVQRLLADGGIDGRLQPQELEQDAAPGCQGGRRGSGDAVAHHHPARLRPQAGHQFVNKPALAQPQLTLDHQHAGGARHELAHDLIEARELLASPHDATGHGPALGAGGVNMLDPVAGFIALGRQHLDADAALGELRRGLVTHQLRADASGQVDRSIHRRAHGAPAGLEGPGPGRRRGHRCRGVQALLAEDAPGFVAEAQGPQGRSPGATTGGVEQHQREQAPVIVPQLPEDTIVQARGALQGTERPVEPAKVVAAMAIRAMDRDRHHRAGREGDRDGAELGRGSPGGSGPEPQGQPLQPAWQRQGVGGLGIGEGDRCGEHDPARLAGAHGSPELLGHGARGDACPATCQTADGAEHRGAGQDSGAQLVFRSVGIQARGQGVELIERAGGGGGHADLRAGPAGQQREVGHPQEATLRGAHSPSELLDDRGDPRSSLLAGGVGVGLDQGWHPQHHLEQHGGEAVADGLPATGWGH